MSRSKVDIRLNPDACNRCGKCERVCEPKALKVAPTYIYLDWRTCTECMKCVQVCDRGAIVRHSTETRAKGAAKSAPKRRTTKAPAAVDAAGAARPASSTGGAGDAGREAAEVAEGPRRGLLERESGARSVAAVADGSARSVGVRNASKRPSAAVTPSVGPVIWTPLEAVAIAAVALATFLGKDALLDSALVAAMPPEGRIMARVGVLVLFYAIQLAVLAVFAHKRGTSLFAAFGLTRIRASVGSWFTAAGWVLLLLLATRIAAWVWGVIAQAIGISAPSVTEAGLTATFGGGTAGLVLSVMLVVLVAPLVEEMLFRGVLLSAIGSRLGAGVALVGQAVLFAAYHFSTWMFVPMLLLGLACGYLAQHRGSLWPAIVLHALFNAVPVALVFLVAT